MMYKYLHVLNDLESMIQESEVKEEGENYRLFGL